MRKGIVILRHLKISGDLRFTIYFLLILPIYLFFTACHNNVVRVPDPDKQLVFPSDHGGHEDAQWEWWYFNGSLETEDGKTYDYFWSFFKVYVDNDTVMAIPLNLLTMAVPFYFPFHFGGFSILDHQENKHKRSYRCTFPFFWKGGYKKSDMKLWLWGNEAWRTGDNTFRVKSIIDGYALDLTLKPERPPLHYGKMKNGTLLHPDTIQKYYSVTRMKTEGVLKKGKDSEKVTGISWMDHQYGFIYNEDLKGYDWLCINLDDGTDILIALVHYFSIPVLPESFCAIMFPDGRNEYIEMDKGNFTMRPLRVWKSPTTRVTYGVDWEIEIPDFDLKLTSKAINDKQEMIIPPNVFWEGSCAIQGTFQGREVSGRGFLETFGDYKVPFIRKLYRSKMRSDK